MKVQPNVIWFIRELIELCLVSTALPEYNFIQLRWLGPFSSGIATILTPRTNLD